MSETKLRALDAQAETAKIMERINERLRMVERLAREVMDWHAVDNDADEWLDRDSKHAAPRTWHPLLDIAAAFQVVERMRELGRVFECEYGPFTDKEWRWMVSFGEGDSHCYCDASLPLAICKAALAAVNSPTPHPSDTSPL